MRLKIVTVSMRRKSGANQPNFLSRVEALLEILNSEGAPDVIASSSSYFSSEKELSDFSNERSKSANDRTLMLLTIGHSKTVGKFHKKSNVEVVEFVYVLYPDGKFVKLATQKFANSSGFNSRKNEFAEDLTSRLFTWSKEKLNISVLSCGEINAFARVLSTGEVLARETFVEEHFDTAGLIFNPTHDRMGRYNVLSPKREYLSREINDQKRCYVSVSNWEVDKNQTQRADTLHTVYVSGKKQPMIRLSLEGISDFECREAIVKL